MHKILPFAMASAFALSVPAEAHYWKLSNSPVFIDQVNESKAFYDGETRPSKAGEDGGTITLVGHSFTSADFISMNVRYGTHRMHYFWTPPPEIIRPGEKFKTRIGWSIAQKWNRFSPPTNGLLHLDWSDDFGMRSLRYGYGDGDADASGYDEHQWTVTTRDNKELLYYTHVACAEGWVRVKWTYTKIDGDAPVGASANNTGGPSDVGTSVGNSANNAGSPPSDVIGPGTADGASGNTGADAATWRVPAGNTGAEPLTAPPEPVAFRNGADGSVSAGVSAPTTFTLTRPTLVTQIMTYHYGFRGRPGTITLRHAGEASYGPWQAAGAGSQSLPNAYWWVRPNVVLQPGAYTVIDSDPSSWSHEAATHGSGVVQIWGKQL